MSRQINLFNPLFLRQKKHFSAVAMLQALGLLVMGLAFFYVYASYQRSNLKSQSAETVRAHTAARDRFARLSAELSPDRQGSQEERELKAAQLAIDARVSMLDRLRSGSSESTEGYSAYLRAFAHQAMDGLWLTAIQIDSAGRQLSVSGRALQPDLLPEYMRRLGREEILKGRPFEKLLITHQDQAAPGKPSIGFEEFALVSSRNTPVQTDRSR